LLSVISYRCKNDLFSYFQNNKKQCIINIKENALTDVQVV